jgi:uracil phosphoribosyltransferase
VSHPIIQHLSTVIVHHKTARDIKNHERKLVGLLLAYETIRDWVRIYKLDIKQVKSRQKITIIDPKESCIVILNSLKHFSYFCEIENLLPKISLELIRENEIDKVNKISNKLNETRHTKAIIVLHELNSKYIVEILEYLIKKQQMQIDQIRLIATLCRKDQMIQLGQKYSHLNIYTSRIL